MMPCSLILGQKPTAAPYFELIHLNLVTVFLFEREIIINHPKKEKTHHDGDLYAAIMPLLRYFRSVLPVKHAPTAMPGT